MVLDRFKENVEKSAREGLKKSATWTQEKLKENAGLTDHTLKDLARLGHPYAIRAYKQIHDPAWLVHRQSGQLQDNIQVKEESKDSIAIGVDFQAVPYAKDVIEGNATMVPRDFPLGTLQEVEDSGVIYAIMERSIDEGVKKS